MDFEIKLIFLIKPGFLTWPKSQGKTQISWERKELLRWNKKHFSRAFKEANNTIFLEVENPTLRELINFY